MILNEGGLKGDVLLVYLTKHVLVTNGTELHRQHGQRDWRSKFEEAFVGGSVPYDRMVELVHSTHSARRFPSEQKATQLEVLSSLVSLLSVAVRFFPEMHYDVWKAVRGSFGKAAKKERVRRNGLDATSAEFVDRPLLWSFAGEGTSEGGGQRYVFLQRHVGLVELVWTTPRSVGSGLRRRVESLDAKARRLQADAAARPGYVSEPWPLLSAEVEPDFASSGEDE